MTVPEPVPPAESVLRWVTEAAGGPWPAVVRSMNPWGSPWLLQAGQRRLVLRTGRPGEAEDVTRIATEAAALRLAAAAGLPAPRLLGHDDGAAAGIPVLLATCLAGSSAIPVRPRPDRLTALGEVTARLHALARQPGPGLPRRDCPIGTVDWPALRAGHDVGPLQRAAQEQLDRASPRRDQAVLVHGDLWQGNVVWASDESPALVDWDCAGAGPPGVDLGSLRMDAAFSYGQSAADELLAAYEQASGGLAPDVAYYDIVAALSTPPQLGWFPTVIASHGRPDLTRELLLRRHEAFLTAALERLP